jgi:serine/threonine-protein kinase
VVVVDGQPAEVRRGVVRISGALGSEHEVKLTVNKQTVSEIVVISESGASPPKLELEVKSGVVRVIKPAGPGGAAGTSAPIVTPGTGKPAVGIEQKFGDD